MKLNPDCCRAIMLAVGEKPFGKNYIFKQLVEKVSGYTPEDIAYSCLKLQEGGFLDITTASPLLGGSSRQITMINDLTYMGHEFLENVRNDGIWKEAKKKSLSVGAFSLSVLSKAAASIIAARFSS